MNMTLVEQCLQRKNLVQVCLGVRLTNNKINILDVLKLDETEGEAEEAEKDVVEAEKVVWSQFLREQERLKITTHCDKRLKICLRHWCWKMCL